MIKINLIPPEYVERLNRRAIIAKAAAAGLISVALVVMLSIWHFTREKTSELRVNRLRVELKNLQGDVDRVKAIEAQIAEVQRYLNSINSITQGRLIYTRFMQDVTENLPGTIWFGGISTILNGPTLAVSFTVNSRSTYDLAWWINALEKDARYSDVVVGGISVSAVENGQILNTTVTLKYTP
jgi:Tfp pilus assembly protein PilN